MTHRHLRQIDCSLAVVKECRVPWAVVGGPAAGTECRGKLIHLPHIWRQKVLHSGCCGWRHNYYCLQRQVDRANEQSTSLRCLWYDQVSYGKNGFIVLILVSFMMDGNVYSSVTSIYNNLIPNLSVSVCLPLNGNYQLLQSFACES